MNLSSPPDFKHWFGWSVSNSSFEKRREPYLQHSTYEKLFKEHLGGIATVTLNLPKFIQKAKLGDLMTSARRRLWDVLDLMSMQYSAGAPVRELAEIWPHAMNWAEEYGHFHQRYHESPENDSGSVTPHASLADNEYWIVCLRLVCFGILTGNGTQLPRAMRFLDYANADLGYFDGLIERLVAFYVPGRKAPPDEATRHLHQSNC